MGKNTRRKQMMIKSILATVTLVGVSGCEERDAVSVQGAPVKPGPSMRTDASNSGELGNRIELAGTAVADWRTSGPLVYSVEKRVVEQGDGEAPQAFEIETNLAVEIVKVSRNTVSIAVVFSDTRATSRLGSAAPLSPAQLAILGMFDNVPFIFMVDQVGRFVDIENWDAVQPVIAEQGELLRDLIVAPLNPGSREYMSLTEILTAELNALIESPAAFRVRALPVVEFLMAPLGRQFPANTAVSRDGRIPHPFAMAMIPASGSFHLDAGSIDEHHICVSFQQAVLRAELENFFAEFLASQFGESVEDSRRRLANYDFQLADEARYDIDVRDGWPREIVYTRRGVGGPTHITERYTFTRSTPASP